MTKPSNCYWTKIRTWTDFKILVSVITLMKPSGNQLVIIFEIVALLTWPISVSKKQQQQLTMFFFFFWNHLVCFRASKKLEKARFCFSPNWGCRLFPTNFPKNTKGLMIWRNSPRKITMSPLVAYKEGRPKRSGQRCRRRIMYIILNIYTYVWDACLNRERLYGLLFRMSAHIRSWFTVWDSFGIYYKSNQVQWIMSSVSFQFNFAELRIYSAGLYHYNHEGPNVLQCFFCRV